MSEEESNPQSELEHQEHMLMQAVKDNPGLIKPRRELAVFLNRQSRWVESMLVLDQCIEINPNAVQIFRMRANTLFKMGHTTKAASNAMQALKLAPNSTNILLFAVYMQLGDLQIHKAQELLDQVFELDPNLEQLKSMKNLQTGILHMNQQSEHDPVKWLSRRLKRRINNVASESD